METSEHPRSAGQHNAAVMVPLGHSFAQHPYEAVPGPAHVATAVLGSSMNSREQIYLGVVGCG